MSYSAWGSQDLLVLCNNDKDNNKSDAEVLW